MYTHRYRRSLELFNRTRHLLPCGGQTLSKAPDRFPYGAYPILLSSGRGSHVKDVDNNDYIDYVCALGPVILGYNYPAVTKALRDQIDTGILTASLETPLVGGVAELICDMIPSAEAVRFVKTGSDACSAAVRLARTYTGRDLILTSGYHGWDDIFQSVAADERGRNGIPDFVSEDVEAFAYGDGLEKHSPLHRPFASSASFACYGQDVAAVIMEPARTFEPPPGYLQAVKDLCHQHGALLIFDEVVTSFRWSVGGAQEYYGVTPDITCLGKAMANGMPLGAVCGRRDIMQAFERCFVSGTYGGETLSLAAAKATLTEIRDHPVIPRIWRQGKKLRDDFDDAMTREGIGARSAGVDVCSVQTFDDPNIKSLWLQETAHRGLLLGNIQYLNYSHTDMDMQQTHDAMDAAAAVVGEAVRSGNIEKSLLGLPIGADSTQLDKR